MAEPEAEPERANSSTSTGPSAEPSQVEPLPEWDQAMSVWGA